MEVALKRLGLGAKAECSPGPGWHSAEFYLPKGHLLARRIEKRLLEMCKWSRLRGAETSGRPNTTQGEENAAFFLFPSRLALVTVIHRNMDGGTVRPVSSIQVAIHHRRAYGHPHSYSNDLSPLIFGVLCVRGGREGRVVECLAGSVTREGA
jgi:hypothetical protein